MLNKTLFWLIFLGALSNISAQNSWVSYQSERGNFLIKFPAEPQNRTKQLNTTLGMLLTESISYAPEDRSANFLYSVNAVYYPKLTFNRDSIELVKVMFDETLTALSENLQCKVVYSYDINIREPFVRVFRLEDKLSGQAVKGQLHLVEDILITLTVFTKIESSLNDDIDRFISSFQWVE